VDEIDELVVWARAHGPLPLRLEGWDYTSVWGWDETTGSLYARLWRNTDDQAKQPGTRIGPDEYTPAITFAITLAQHIAMATGYDPWSVIARMDQVVLEQSGGASWYDGESDIQPRAGGTVVTISEGYSGPEWPYGP
jgi:hypothetical protein